MIASRTRRHAEHKAQERLRFAHQRRMTRRLAAEFNRVARAGNATGHEARLVVLLTQEYRLVFDDFGKRLGEQLGLFSMKAGSTAYERAANRYVRKNALKKAVGISATTKEKLKRVIEEAVKEGDQALLERAIREKIGGDEGARRAETIARTEAHSASQDAAFELAQEAEIDLVKVWTAVQDGRTRESHADADGQERNMEEQFTLEGEDGETELLYPGDPSGPPEETINCRCVAIYVPKKRGAE